MSELNQVENTRTDETTEGIENVNTDATTPTETIQEPTSMSPSTPASLASPYQDPISKHSKKVLEQLSKDMIKSTGEYIKDEIDICISDYKLLEQMNKLVAEKYKNLTQSTSGISGEMKKLNEAYNALTPLLSQIDEVENSVSELEQSALKLDAYSKRLEAKFKQFTDKILNK